MNTPQSDEGAGLVLALSTMAQGEASAEMDALLVEAVKAVQCTGKKASLTLKIELAVGGEGKVIVRYDASSKLPKTPKLDSVFFVSESGGLQVDDPKNPMLPEIRESMQAEAARFGKANS